MTLRTQVLVWAGFTVVVILLIWLFRPILLPFVIGIALAYILNPAVTLVQRAGIGRAWATAIVLLAVLGVIVGLFVVVTPLVLQQVIGLAGRLPGHDGRPGMALAAWQTHPAFAGPDARIGPEYLWCALDCPGATAVLGEDDPRIVLTGRMTAVVEHLPVAGEACVVAGWALGGEGRKLYSGTAVADSSGRILARAHITWIVVRNG